MSEEEHQPPAEDMKEQQQQEAEPVMTQDDERATENLDMEQEEEPTAVVDDEQEAVEEDETVDHHEPVVEEVAAEEPVVTVQAEEEEKACDAAEEAGAQEESCTAEGESCTATEEQQPPPSMETERQVLQEVKAEPKEPVIDAPPGCCDGCSGDGGASTTTTPTGARTLVGTRPPFTVVMQEMLSGNGYLLKNHKHVEIGAGVALLYACIFYFFWTRRNRQIRQAAALQAQAEKDALLGEGGSSTSRSKEVAALNAAAGSNPAATGFSFPMADLVYVADLLTPDSSHMDIIYALISSPQVLAHSCAALETVHEIKQRKLQQQAAEEKKKKKQPDVFSNLVDQDGWGDDDDDDENDENISEEARQAARKAKEEERQKKLHMERLKAATGQALPLLEGVDEGVLGQRWVEETLAIEGQWPPPSGLGILEGKTFAYKDPATGETLQLMAMDHPGLRRNLCMTAGRLNSIMLNTHADLIQAGQDKLIDQSYFKGAMEFRMRIIMLLEQSLRVALTLRSYKLFSTMVECIALFKIGCVPNTGLPWFNGQMARTYDTLPRLAIGQVIFTKHVKPTSAQQQQQQQQNSSGPSEIIPTDTIVAGQTAAVVVPVERTHAEKFTRTKLVQWKKQGIPPQVAMSSYREGWWFLLRCERLDGSNADKNSRKGPLNTEDGAKVLSKIHPNTVKRFNETATEFHLVTAWPMIVQNIGQKSGTVKISVTAPEEPGKYRFHVGIQSQDFLGADQEVFVDVTVVDGNPTPTIHEGEEEDDDNEIHDVD